MIRFHVQLWCVVQKPIHRINPPTPKGNIFYFILATTMQPDIVEQKEGAYHLAAMH